MIRTSEEQHLHELIEIYVAPLRSEIKALRKELAEQQVKNLNIPAVSNLLCGSFETDNKTSSATKCKCGREKWEHHKAT